jgi:hypothetical protein
MKKDKFNLPKLLANTDSSLPYSGLSFTDDDLAIVAEILTSRKNDSKLISIISAEPGEALCFLLYMYNHYSMLSNSHDNFTVSAHCAVDFSLEYIKDNPRSIYVGMSFTDLYEKVVNFIEETLQQLTFDNAKSHIEIYDSSDGCYSAAYCINVKLKKYFIQTMRFVDGFTLVRRLLLAEEDPAKLSSKNWSIPCESVPQVFCTDTVSFDSFPKLLNVRIKHLKKNRLDTVYVEVVSENMTIDSFYVSSPALEVYTPTLAAYAYYIVATRFYKEFSHVKVRSNLNLNISDYDPSSLAYDLMRIAGALFPVSEIECVKKVSVLKSKITDKVRLEPKNFSRLSEILGVQTNVGRLQLTRHAVLRFIERVLILEGRYVSCAFVQMAELLSSTTWRLATQYEKDLYELQIDKKSSTWINDETPYCFVSTGGYLLTVVVKNFKDAVEAANVLRD